MASFLQNQNIHQCEPIAIYKLLLLITLLGSIVLYSNYTMDVLCWPLRLFFS